MVGLWERFLGVWDVNRVRSKEGGVWNTNFEYQAVSERYESLDRLNRRLKDHNTATLNPYCFRTYLLCYLCP